MNIGFDATSLCRKITGIENYALHLLLSLLKYDKDNHYTVFFRYEIHPKVLPYQEKADFVLCPFKSQMLCEQIWLPYIILRKKLDIMHYPAFPPGLLTFKQSFMTIHDAAMWKYPHTFSWRNRYYMKPLSYLAAKRCRKIITVSDLSVKDISEFCHIDENKIINTSESISEKFRLIEDKDVLNTMKAKYSLPESFILSVGTIEPRKNITTLIKAFKVLKESKKDLPFKLVLIGRMAWGKNPVLNQIKELGLEDDVVMTGYVPEEDMIAIYNLAEVFVFPSLYEGFGLPPLEAMASGTPVIASTAESIKEVCADAAILLEPHDVDGFAKHIFDILSNNDKKQDYKRKGLERSKLFSWEKVAKRTIEVYESAKRN